jgi:DNA-binding GntR family transcriptional regulator
VLGTSQTPAREAVRRLAHEGLVTYQPRLGNFVTEISQVEAREAREVRVLLESAAARRATGRVPEHELQLLRTEVRLMMEAAEHHDIGAFREADLRFHRQVLATSGNSMLLKVWRTLEPALWSLQVVSNAMYAGDWGLMARRHLDLVLVLGGTDPEDAARLFSAHARGESSITRPAARHD